MTIITHQLKKMLFFGVLNRKWFILFYSFVITIADEKKISSSDKTNIQKTTIDDPYIQMKIDFSKPVNFLIHGWYGIIPEPEGIVPFRETGM